jgi:cytoskeletal protein RodZ
MLRAGTLGGATVLWMTPAVNVYAMSQIVAEPTSGLSTTDTTQPPRASETTQPPQTTETTQPTHTTGTTEPDGSTPVTSPSPPSDVEVRDTEVTSTTAPGAPTSDDVTVGGKAIVADVTPPGTATPSVSPPLIAQAELPQTGFDAERAAILGVALSGAGAALLAATREQSED